MSLFVCSLPCFPAPPPSLPINLHTCFPCTHHKIICLLAYNNNLLSFCLIFESLCILSVRLTVLTRYSKVCQSALLSSTPTSFSSSFAQPQLTSLPRTFPVLFHSATCLLATQSKASLPLQPTTPHILPPLASLNPMPLSESTLIAPIPSWESNNRLSLPVASLSLCFSFNLHQLMTAWPVYVKQLKTSSYVFFVCLFVFWRVSIGLPMHLSLSVIRKW